MIKFKREKTPEKIREDKFVNAFHKKGFLNEDIFETTDRDMWISLSRVLSSTNNIGVFKGILAGYKELPYSEELSQSIIIKDSKKNKLGDKDRITYATTEPQLVKYVECLFFYSPIFYDENRKAIEIKNTLNKLKKYKEEGFKVFPHIITFLENQLKIHFFNKNQKETDEDLFIRGGNPILQVPILQDNAYYSIHGMIRFPYMGEFHYKNRTVFDQIEIYFLRNNRKKGGKKGGKLQVTRGYFDAAYVYNDKGEEVSIFYLRIGGKRFYLPFLFFDKNQIDELMRELMNMEIVSSKVKAMLEATYEIYLAYLKADKENLGFNRVPSLKIWKEGDEYYEKDEVNKETFEEVKDDGKEDYIDYGANRNIISIDQLKSLILGYNDYIIMSYYPHMGFHLMNIPISKSNYNQEKDNEVKAISPLDAPRELMITKTIKSNAEMFKTFDNTNFIDVFHLVSYKMSLLELTDEKQATITTNNDRYASKRYRNIHDYGLIDPFTIKSAEHSGLQGNLTMLNFYKNHFYFHDKK